MDACGRTIMKRKESFSYLFNYCSDKMMRRCVLDHKNVKDLLYYFVKNKLVEVIQNNENKH